MEEQLRNTKNKLKGSNVCQSSRRKWNEWKAVFDKTVNVPLPILKKDMSSGIDKSTMRTNKTKSTPRHVLRTQTNY